MKKYIYIFKSEVMSSMQYVFEMFGRLILYFFMIFVFTYLWKYIYSNPEELINGYTMSQMIWYVMITEVLWFGLGGRNLCRKISNDVKSGNIAYNLNKPYNYVQYALASRLGEILIRTVIYIVAALVMGIFLVGDFPNIGFLGIVAVLFSGILATVINILLITFIGMFSFFMEDAHPLYWLYSKLILVLGTLFPVEFFPEVIQKVFVYSPVYVVSYGPAKLFVDFSIERCISILIAQIAYVFIAYGLCMILYKKGVKRLNVNGG